MEKTAAGARRGAWPGDGKQLCPGIWDSTRQGEDADRLLPAHARFGRRCRRKSGERRACCRATRRMGWKTRRSRSGTIGTGRSSNPRTAKYHLFASRWDHSTGHKGWTSSVAVHAVSDNVIGPYEDKGMLWPDNMGGKGHNVTALIMPDGRYAVTVSEIRPGEVFASKSPDGPWESLGTDHGRGPAQVACVERHADAPARRAVHDRPALGPDHDSARRSCGPYIDSGAVHLQGDQGAAPETPGRPGRLVQRRTVSHRREQLEACARRST